MGKHGAFSGPCERGEFPFLLAFLLGSANFIINDT